MEYIRERLRHPTLKSFQLSISIRLTSNVPYMHVLFLKTSKSLKFNIASLCYKWFRKNTSDLSNSSISNNFSSITLLLTQDTIGSGTLSTLKEKKNDLEIVKCSVVWGCWGIPSIYCSGLYRYRACGTNVLYVLGFDQQQNMDACIYHPNR